MKAGITAKVILWIAFVAMLLTPLAIQKMSARREAAQAKLDESHALARYGFHLQEVSQQAGVHFVHQAPTLDAKLDGIMPQVTSMGASVSVVDFDRDGWPDLYVTNSKTGSLNCLYRNLHDGTFQDVAGAMAVADVNQSGTGVSMGAVWGDYDNDGYEDLFLIKWGKPELFHNNQGRGFTRVDEGLPRFFPPWINANTAVWFDYDGDGLLDLFVGGYYSENVDLWHLRDTRIMPESFEYAKNGGRKYLFHNLGGGKFEEVSEQVGIKSNRWALAASAADLRGTGHPDLFIANDYGVAELYLNQGGHFQEAGEATGVGFAPKSGMNVAYGDILNQGKYAIYVSNISEEGVLIQGNNLWVPQEGGATLKYANLARDMGVELGGWSFGAQFGDLNNDGTLDLYLTNGYVSLSRTKSYWYDFSRVAGGNSKIINDAANWPAMDGRSLSGYQQKKVWINDGAARFADVAQAVGANDTYDGRSVVMADLWNRGVLDVVVANQRGPLVIYKNTVAPENEWLEFSLEGSKSNRSAIGAQVTLYWNGQQQVQQVSGGSGFAAQNDRRVHFGLGKKAQVEKAVIQWPSGKVQTVQPLSTGKIYSIKEAE